MSQSLSLPFTYRINISEGLQSGSHLVIYRSTIYGFNGNNALSFIARYQNAKWLWHSASPINNPELFCCCTSPSAFSCVATLGLVTLMGVKILSHSFLSIGKAFQSSLYGVSSLWSFSCWCYLHPDRASPMVKQFLTFSHPIAHSLPSFQSTNRRYYFQWGNHRNRDHRWEPLRHYFLVVPVFGQLLGDFCLFLNWHIEETWSL